MFHIENEKEWLKVYEEAVEKIELLGDYKRAYERYSTMYSTIDASIRDMMIIEAMTEKLERLKSVIDRYTEHGSPSVSGPVFSGVSAKVESYSPGLFGDKDVRTGDEITVDDTGVHIRREI